MHTKKTAAKWSLSLLLTFALALIVVLGASAAVWTDLPDYAPGSVVTIRGDNSDGAGYQAGETVHVDVAGPNGYATMCEGVADDAGAWSCEITLWANDLAIGSYNYTASGQASAVQQTGTFLDGNAPGSLYCPSLPKYGNNPTHYAMPVGSTTTCQIVGASDVQNGPVTVFIKTSNVGNLQVTGTAATVGGVRIITFTFTAPAAGCNTANLAYDKVGNTANADFVDDDMKNNSTNASSGLGFVNASGAPITCSANKDLAVSKTAAASYVRAYNWTLEKSVDQELINTSGTATFNYTLQVVKSAPIDSGWKVDGVITVSNPNSTPVTGVNVTDALCAVSNADNLTVPANGSVSVPYTCSFDANPGNGTNTATATWVSYGSPSTSASGTAAFTFGAPATVTNDSITVKDSNGGSWSFSDSGSVSYPQSYTDPAGTCTDHVNTATILETKESASKTVKVCVGKDLAVSKTAQASFKRTYTWDLTKELLSPALLQQAGSAASLEYLVKAFQTGVVDSDWKVSGVITVQNPNDWEAITAGLSDAVDNGGACVLDAAAVTVPAGGTQQVGYTCSYDSAPTSASGVNTATAAWDAAAAATPHGSASGTAGFEFSSPEQVNPSITVKDTFNGVETTLGALTAADSEPFASAEYPYTHSVTGTPGDCTTFDNTAVIVETGKSGSASARLCVGADLQVSKTAVPFFTRTYTWDLSKAVDKTHVEQAGLETSFNYVVNAWQTGFTDSGWSVSGVITVKNPNTWEAITADLSDAVDNGGTCTVSSSQVSVAAGETQEIGYTCAYSAAPTAVAGVNTAALAWDSAAFFTPNSRATGTAGFAFDKPEMVNDTITISDSFNGETTILGNLSATDAQPFASNAFKYSRKVGAAAGECASFNNTAAIVETGATASQAVELCVGADLQVSKTAEPFFKRTYQWAVSKDVDQTLIEKSQPGAAFHYTVDAWQTGFEDSGWIVNGVVTVKNPNQWQAVTADLSDAVDNGGTCTLDAASVTVPAGGSVDVAYTCDFTSGASGVNTAAAAWDSSAFHTPGGSATGTAGFAFTTPTTRVNDTITVNDSLQGGLGSLTGTDEAPFASGTFTYERWADGAPGTCETIDNTATIVETGAAASKTVRLCVGADLTVSKTAEPSFVRSYTWDLSKAVDQTLVKQSAAGLTLNYTVNAWQTGLIDSGWKVEGKITVANPNDWQDITADLSDAVDNGGTCVLDDASVTVPAGETREVGYTCTYSKEPTSTAGMNTATAAWDSSAFHTPGGSASGTADFVFTAPTTRVNDTITVNDSVQGKLGSLKGTDEAPFAKSAFTYSRDVTGVPGKCATFDNTAVIVETKASAAASSRLCVGADLTVSKTAEPFFKRSYAWNLKKAVDKTLVEQAGGAATFTYQVDAWQTGFTDSEWVVKGAVTLNNPNDWQAVEASLSDAVDNGGQCTLDAAQVNIPAGETRVVKYTCTYDSKPAYTGLNTATAAWDQEASFTPSGSASGTAEFEFVTPTAAENKVISVTDKFASQAAVTLGTLTAADGAPYASASFKYSKPVAVPQNDCLSYDNTATIVETGKTASQGIKVCGPAKTGGLTMGFWQNKNGQAIITGQAKTGVCPSTAWLRGYAPFQDLSATATCAQVGTYVTTVIKAANASGASMNAMLKAQMLASALDVYFSDPALGGNKINAPKPLGGVVIDLTRVCAVSGSGCGSASAAFGGASSLSVSQLLAYAASQSNAGGSAWYANVKATQELAKNTFDAINNQAAYAPFEPATSGRAVVEVQFKVFLPQVNR
jgi:hypothetical protein